MSHQPQHKFGGDLGTHLCSSAATTKPQDASSVQTEEYKVLEGRWEQRGQDRSEWGHRGAPTSLSQPCYRKAPRPWEKMIRGYPLLRGLKGPFQLTGTLQEPAGRRNPQERGGHEQWVLLLLLEQVPAQLQLCLQHPPRHRGWA